jgi:hypothetical protein
MAVNPNQNSLNFCVLGIFAPLLILTGVLGFILPPRMSLTSGAPAYNIFHLVFGALGLALVIAKNEGLIRLFNIGFGALDVYQAIASFAGLFPQQYFQWTLVDDALHVMIGIGLMAVGLMAKKVNLA